MMVVVAVIVMSFGRMHMIAVAVRIVMIDDVAARMTPMRARKGNEAGKDGSKQRQKNNCLNHARAPRGSMITNSRGSPDGSQPVGLLCRIMP